MESRTNEGTTSIQTQAKKSDNILKIHAQEGGAYRAECEGVDMQDMQWPALAKKTRFNEVHLDGCMSIGINYASALEDVNVTFTNELHLSNLPANTLLGHNAFSEMPSLRILTVASKRLALLPRALTELIGLRKLTLRGVKADQLPLLRLEELEMIDTATGVLELENFNARKLKLTEPNLRFINASVPKLKILVLRNMRSLKTLALHDVSLELTLDGILELCPRLELLELKRARAQEVSASLLRGASNLTFFTYTDTNITTLPEGFFGYVKQSLTILDLRNNKLETLPAWVFWGLSKLSELHLSGNRLSARVVRAVIDHNLEFPTVLDLSGNPLGDLCPREWALEERHLKAAERQKNSTGVSCNPIFRQRLQALSLARTGAKRICFDWLTGFVSLNYVDLRGNYLVSLNCEEFKYSTQRGLGTHFDLRGTYPGLTCDSQTSNEKNTTEHKVIDKIKLVINTPEDCDNCDCAYAKCVKGLTPPILELVKTLESEPESESESFID